MAHRNSHYFFHGTYLREKGDGCVGWGLQVDAQMSPPPPPTLDQLMARQVVSLAWDLVYVTNLACNSHLCCLCETPSTPACMSLHVGALPLHQDGVLQHFLRLPDKFASILFCSWLVSDTIRVCFVQEDNIHLVVSNSFIKIQ